MKWVVLVYIYRPGGIVKYKKHTFDTKKQVKVEIPKFVADYIEHTKNEDYHLLGAMCEVRKHENKEIDDWLYTDDNIEAFALAWMFGYTIKKDKRYFVKIKATKHCFAKDGKGKIFYSLAYKSCFTQAELEKAGFGWVFDCTGIELLEVE